MKRTVHAFAHPLFRLAVICLSCVGAFALASPGVAQAASLPWPHWWGGDCNNAGRLLTTGTGVVAGLEVCAPSGGGLGGTVQVNFDGEGAEQWQCGELSLRYMDIAWGVTSYNLATSDNIANYFPFSRYPSVQKITNGTAGVSPQPGDVMQLHSNTTGPGHTGVVESNSVDGNGNGSITMLSENGNSTGRETLSVSNWNVSGDGPNYTTAWLHNGGSSSGSTSRAPVIGRNYDGRLEAFQVGSDGQLYHIWQTAANAGWTTGWSGLGGNWPNSAPVVALDAAHHLEIFMRGTTNQIYVNAQTSGGWSGWNAITTNFTAIGDPTVVANADGRLEVFAIGAGSDHGLWHNWQSTAGTGTWQSGWSSLGGYWPAGHAAAVMDQSSKLEVFMRGTTNQIYVDAQSGGWSGWNAIASSFTAISDPTVGINADGRLEVFAVGAGSDHGLYHDWQTTAGTGNWYSGWSSLGGYWPSGNAVSATDANGILEVFMRGTTKQIYLDTQSGGWSGWNAIDSTFTSRSDPGVAMNADGRLEVFAVGGGTDDALWHNWQGTPGTGNWQSGWSNLGGNFPS